MYSSVGAAGGDARPCAKRTLSSVGQIHSVTERVLRGGGGCSTAQGNAAPQCCQPGGRRRVSGDLRRCNAFHTALEAGKVVRLRLHTVAPPEVATAASPLARRPRRSSSPSNYARTHGLASRTSEIAGSPKWASSHAPVPRRSASPLNFTCSGIGGRWSARVITAGRCSVLGKRGRGGGVCGCLSRSSVKVLAPGATRHIRH